jgi:hypothetical protein
VLESFAPILGALRKASPVPFFAIGLATSFVVFTPDSWATAVGIDELRVQPRQVFGLLFIVSWSLLITYTLAWVVRKANELHASRLRGCVRAQSLTELTSAEKRCLAMYVRGNHNTHLFPLDEGVVGGLVRKDILFQACSQAEFHAFPFNLQPWARRYLSAHPNLLDDVPGPPRREADNSPVWHDARASGS